MADSSEKTYIPENEGKLEPSASQIGATMEALVSTINARKLAGEESYTYRLLSGKLDDVLKKICEESLETALAAKETEMLDIYSKDDSFVDASIDHLRYEAADVVYHLLVLLARFDIPIDEFAAELNTRMREDERPRGGACLKSEHVKRGK